MFIKMMKNLSASHNCETPNKRSTKSDQNDDPKEVLKNLRLKNINRLLCARLNVKFIRNKFDSIVDIVNNNIDILMISETKVDPSLVQDSFTFMAFLNLTSLIEMVTVVEYFCIFVKNYLQN